MTTQHTPGPWTVAEGPHSLEIAGYLQDGRIAGVPVRIGATGLAFRAQKSGAGRGQSPRWYDFSEQDRATARLIAAAPELLEALEIVKDMAIAMRGEDFNLGYEQWKKVHAAIAKARGES